MMQHYRSLSLAVAACLTLVACGEPTETASVAASRASGPRSRRPPPSPVIATEPPVSRQPDIPPPSAHIALNPGLYRADEVELSLSALRFELAIPGRDIAAEGGYEVINGVLVLSATGGETGDVAFPLECQLVRAGPSIAFDDVEDGSCGVLDGLRFQRESRPG